MEKIGVLRILRFVGWKAALDAAAELVVVASISLAPIFLGAFVQWLRTENKNLTLETYIQALDRLLEHGEFFMCALAFVAIVAWHVFKEWPPELKPPRVIFGLICFILSAGIAVFYSIDASRISLHVELFVDLSKCVLAFTLALYYISTLLTRAEGTDYFKILSEGADRIGRGLPGGDAS